MMQEKHAPEIRRLSEKDAQETDLVQRKIYSKSNPHTEQKIPKKRQWFKRKMPKQRPTLKEKVCQKNGTGNKKHICPLASNDSHIEKNMPLDRHWYRDKKAQ